MKKYFIFVIKILISLVLVFFLFQKYNWHLALENIKDINISYLFLSAFVLLLAWLLNSKKWQILLEHIKIEQGLLKLLYLNLISFFYATILPGGQITGETIKCLKITKNENEKGKLVFSVLLDRVTGLVSFIILGFVAIIITDSEFIELFKLKFIFFLAVLFSLFIIFLFNKKIADKFSRVLKINKQENQKGLKKFLGKIFELIFVYQGAYRLLFVSLLYGVIFQLFNVLHIYILAKALSLNVSFVDLIWILSIVSIILVLPITLMGLGLREGSFVYFLALLGVLNSVSLSFSLLISFVLFSFSLLGGLLELAAVFGKRRTDGSDNFN